MAKQDDRGVPAQAQEEMTRRIGARAQQLDLERAAALFGVDVLDVLNHPPPACVIVEGETLRYVEDVLEPALAELERWRAGTDQRS